MLRHLATVSCTSRSLWGQAVYHGPKFLGPYTVEHRVSNEALFRILGQPVYELDSFCYESSDGNFSLSFERIADNPSGQEGRKGQPEVILRLTPTRDRAGPGISATDLSRPH